MPKDNKLNNGQKQTKTQDLYQAVNPPTPELTDNLGHQISDDQNSLRAGTRGPTLLEDFHFREKLHHFDHERIPERVVHARGAGAHGIFQVYHSLEQYTTAKVLTDPTLKTPVFVRFSTVAGSRGSADTARDVRGFAVKMYTPEGNWDIVGNNIPVFFIQDAIKFPDLIHAAKPEPHNEIPQAQTAHDTFWDFISLTPESMHMVMWIMSDRAIPRSYAMMEGFGVHTFRLVNAQGQSHFVKFHWKPLAGVHSLVWDEAQRLAGKDPDFHRRDLWEAIELGNYPEWELGLQLIPEGEETKFDFDVLDATKIWPEDLIPVQRVGKLTLNRNPDNYFTETEQVAFMTTNIVPGIDFTDDPLLQGRNFSYLDTQLSRLGSPNWPELPINRPLAKVSNNQREGHMRYTINPGRVSYEPNSLGGNIPNQVPPQQGGFTSYPAPVQGPKVRVRSESFGDHYGQARLFWNSMSGPEKEHIVKALQFELSLVETREIRQRMLAHLTKINEVLAAQVALALGELSLPNPAEAEPGKNGSKLAKPNGTADSMPETQVLLNAVSPTSASGGLERTSALSQEESPKNSVKGRKVAVLAADGVAADQLKAVKTALEKAGAQAKVVGPHLGVLTSTNGATVPVDRTFANSASIMFDGVIVVGGATSVATLLKAGDAHEFVNEAFKHAKTVAAIGEGVELLTTSQVGKLLGLEPNGSVSNQSSSQLLQGVLTGKGSEAKTVVQSFIQALAQHRHWNRAVVEHISA
jgi:catalase